MSIRVTCGSAHCKGTQADGSSILTKASVATVEGEGGVGVASPSLLNPPLIFLTHFWFFSWFLDSLTPHPCFLAVFLLCPFHVATPEGPFLDSLLINILFCQFFLNCGFQHSNISVRMIFRSLFSALFPRAQFRCQQQSAFSHYYLKIFSLKRNCLH